MANIKVTCVCARVLSVAPSTNVEESWLYRMCCANELVAKLKFNVYFPFRLMFWCRCAGISGPNLAEVARLPHRSACARDIVEENILKQRVFESLAAQRAHFPNAGARAKHGAHGG